MTESAPVRQVFSPCWVDFQVTRENGKELLLREGLPGALIDLALYPGALPKLEVDGDTTFWLLRSFDEEADGRSASTRDLTHKIAIFHRSSGVITAHRFPASYFGNCKADSSEQALLTIVDKVLHSYLDALAKSEDSFDDLEARVFNAKGTKPFRTQEGYLFRRRLIVIRKMLVLMHDTLETAVSLPNLPKSLKNIRKRVEILIASTDSLLEQVNHLFQLNLAFMSQKTNEASQRTNEVMRILTVFSAFFLPLSFIAGVYGMNFQNMPELHHPHGYPATLLLMFAVAAGIWIWFKRKGWIDPPQS